MRALALLVPLVMSLPACGDDGGGTPFAPVIVPGGGARDPGIDGDLGVFVIDAESDAPLAGVSVHVGDATATTDATGVAVFSGVSGPQTIAVAASAGHAAALWVGVDGASVTVPVDRSPPDVRPPQAQLTGSITGWGAMPDPDPDHVRLALISFSLDPELGSHANEITQPPSTGLPTASCLRSRGGATTPCAWKLNARAGAIALGLIMIDIDNRHTPETTDDVTSFIGYAVKPITVVDRMNQSGVMLDLPGPESGVRPTVTLGTPPASLPQVAAVVGLDLGATGLFRINGLDPTRAGVLVPSVSIAPGSSYELLGVATEAGADPAQSIVRRRGITDPTQLSLSGWMAPPTGVASDRASVSFTSAGGGPTIVELDNAALGVEGRRVLSIAVFDGSSPVAIPAAVALPADPLTVRVTTLDPGAPVDPGAFEVEALINGVVAAASDSIELD